MFYCLCTIYKQYLEQQDNLFLKTTLKRQVCRGSKWSDLPAVCFLQRPWPVNTSPLALLYPILYYFRPRTPGLFEVAASLWFLPNQSRIKSNTIRAGSEGCSFSSLQDFKKKKRPPPQSSPEHVTEDKRGESSESHHRCVCAPVLPPTHFSTNTPHSSRADISVYVSKNLRGKKKYVFCMSISQPP